MRAGGLWPLALGPQHGWKVRDIARYCAILRDIARYRAILCDTFRYLAINHELSKILAKAGLLSRKMEVSRVEKMPGGKMATAYGTRSHTATFHIFHTLIFFSYFTRLYLRLYIRYKRNHKGVWGEEIPLSFGAGTVLCTRIRCGGFKE